ncbi:hypothetical protein ACH5RR_040863 [Cinchona calisaya]|uniref:DNA damage-binding protein 1 n=1 Tax=Cinchona calisaya TaxID=153742 RepID=A0ABD2XUH4_9GENT
MFVYLQPMLDVPIYGRIATLELFRPHGEAQVLLFITTEKYKFCVLQWDPEAFKVVTRAMGDVSDRMGCRPAYSGQICVIDPDFRLIGLHLYEESFKVIPFDNQGQLMETINIRLKELQVLDIKFLYGGTKPTIVVLYQDDKDARHLKTYEVNLKDEDFVEGPWSRNNLVGGPNLLIPVPPPLCGVLILGEKRLVYCGASASISSRISHSITRTYGRVDCDSSLYLLGDHNGLLRLLMITHEKEKVTALKIENLGTTSIASTISCLNDAFVYIGSSYGDSQDRVAVQGIKGMWSLRSATNDFYDTTLVYSFINETCVLKMNLENELKQTETAGFCLEAQTLYCHNAVYNQLLQVTSNSVRLVSSTSKELQHEWFAPVGFSLNIATANATQVLLATGGGHLLYLEIGDRVLTEVMQTQLEYDISCLDINPIGQNSNHSHIAVVGTWNDISVRIFSLPELNLMTKEHLGGEIIPRSVLLCAFEGVSYLLCALGDGHLLNFVLNMDTGELTDRKKVSLGTQHITLCTFSSKNATYVFAASERATVIYSSNKKLLYSNVILKEASHVCPFNPEAFPDSLAIAREGELAICTIDDIQKLHIRSISLGEHAHCICHQEQTRTFAMCTIKYSWCKSIYLENHSVQLMDDQTFQFIHTFVLENHEHAYSIVSCSFSGDTRVCYCVGTAYVRPDEEFPTEGQILVFTVVDIQLALLAVERTKGIVYSLKAFNGKLLAAIDQRIELYKFVIRENNGHELHSECGHDCHTLTLCILTRGDFIIVGNLRESISLFIYKDGAIKEQARDYNVNWMSAVEILNDDIYLGAEKHFNLFTVRKNSKGATNEEHDRLEVAGKYHLGEIVNRFQHRSLVMHFPDSEVEQIPTVIFGTVNGAIGLIASLPSGKISKNMPLFQISSICVPILKWYSEAASSRKLKKKKKIALLTRVLE